MKRSYTATAWLLLLVAAVRIAAAGATPSDYAAESTAEEVLNGTLVRPPPPSVEVCYDDSGFAADRLNPVPAVGVHPRILFGPDDVGDIRKRSEETRIGRTLMGGIRDRNHRTLYNPETWEHRALTLFARGDAEGAGRILRESKETVAKWSFQMALTSATFDALLQEDADRGRLLAAAVAGYSRLLETRVDDFLAAEYADNVARTGSWHALGSYALYDWDTLGLCYDFAHPFMTEDQRSATRRVIAKITRGRMFHGMELPPHWRNWNWITHGAWFPIMALAIEGEPGYDHRVYEKSVEVFRDFLTYGISAMGTSREAIGYTCSGMKHAEVAMIAMARRGDNLFLHDHYRNMKFWFLHAMQPYGRQWISYGDLGNFSPALQCLQIRKYFYPNDPIVDYLYQMRLEAKAVADYTRPPSVADATQDFPGWIREPSSIAAIGCALDSEGTDYRYGRALEQPLTRFDPERGWLVTRTSWDRESVSLQFECRPDTVYVTHQHGDRGAFTFSALGRAWAIDHQRSADSRYHSVVNVDGKGQGHYPPPGEWLGLVDTPEATFGVCDAKYAYDWHWPKPITVPGSTNVVNLSHPRWERFQPEIEANRLAFERLGLTPELETMPKVAAFYRGYMNGSPRVWDGDGWVWRVKHNPVERAFRTVGLVRGRHPYVLVIDDIRKDAQPHLYHWTMMLCEDLELVRIDGRERRKVNGVLTDQPGHLDIHLREAVGDRRLLVRVLDMADEAPLGLSDPKPDIRLEVFKLRHRLQKRLVIPSRSVRPNYKVLLFPHREGDELPATAWSKDASSLTLAWPDQRDVYDLFVGPDGRTRFTLTRNHRVIASVAR